jgi:hypothetical protein
MNMQYNAEMFHVRQVQKGTDNNGLHGLSALNCDGLCITYFYNILHALHISDSQWVIIAKQEELRTIYSKVTVTGTKFQFNFRSFSWIDLSLSKMCG